MSAQEIRQRVKIFERTVFWENALNYVFGFLGVAFLSFCIVWPGFPQYTLIRLGLGMTMAAVLYILWQIHRRSPFRRVPEEMGAVSCLDFYRKELELRRDHRRKFWWDIGPAIPGVAILWVAMARIHPSHQWHPGLALVGVVTVSVLITSYFWRQSAIGARKLQDEIDELNALREPH
jgi:hypothetical protein